MYAGSGTNIWVDACTMHTHGQGMLQKHNTFRVTSADTGCRFAAGGPKGVEACSLGAAVCGLGSGLVSGTCCCARLLRGLRAPVFGRAVGSAVRELLFRESEKPCWLQVACG